MATMIQLSQDGELVAQDNEQFGSADESDIENQLPNPPDDESDIENQLPNPLDDERDIEDEFSDSTDDESDSENQLSNPLDDERVIEDEFSDSLYDESYNENQLSNLLDDERDIEDEFSDSTDDESDIENQPPNPPDDENYRKACRSLRDSALKDEWTVAQPILKKYPRIVVEKLTTKGETVLHIATKARSILFVGELMKLMKVSDLELIDNGGFTAFFRAAGAGCIEIAKAMVERNKKLPNISINSKRNKNLPINLAAGAGLNAMVSYLIEVTSLDEMGQNERLRLLHSTICNEMYDVALTVFSKDSRNLAIMILESHADILHLLSQTSLAISNREVKSNRKFTSAISMARCRFISWLLPERCVLKQQAGQLFEELWAECVRCSEEEELLKLVIKQRLLYSAAKAGNVEFLAVCFRSYPNLIWRANNHGWTIFHVAVLYRQEKVFSLIHQLGLKSFLPLKCDKGGNNILHLAGRLGYYNNKNDIPQGEANNKNDIPRGKAKRFKYSNLNDKEKIMPPSFLRVSGAALQMQREILCFKEVEKLLPPSHHKKRNKDGKTPRELFTKEHELLLKEGEKWMKHTANSCMLVATLIATVVFAAGFTVPGGNNDADGIPILLKLNGFRVFIISDAVALFSSIISIIMFLSILTSRYAEEDFLVSLPAKLLFGLTTLFVSIVSMLVAFTTTFFLFYSNHMGNWEPKLIAACAGVPVALFGCLQYKLWFDVAKSTYWSKFHFRSGKYKLY